MRRVHLFLGLCGTILIGSFGLYLRTVQPRSDDASARIVSPDVEEQSGSSPSTGLATVSADNAREAVRVPDSVTEDPCASVTVELAAERAARAAAEEEVARLKKELADVGRELSALKFPEDTPYGAFLASPEAESISEPDIRRSIKAWLDEFPVVLRLGEATWIAERYRADDWRKFGRSSQDALVSFLGPERLAAELPLDSLFTDYLWNDDHGPRLQAALPPEKRAELEARLHSIMEKSKDPEEIAWLLEKFPSFFD